jgi:L-threonate 2-dehydrogenase
VLVVAVIAPGAMGAAVGQVLVGNGVEVRTVLAGRSPASAARAEAAGMQPVALEQIAEAAIVLSIVPPGEALALAEHLAPVLRARPGVIYADCNAVSPQTVQRIGAVATGAGARFVDAGIIGSPPRPGGDGPVFYASGPDAPGFAALAQHGLTVKVLDGPIGAASGLKMSYGGITKGITALASAMMLAATRFGAAEELAAELAESQPALLAWFRRSVPGMYSKAYRWVAEMEEVATFAGEDAATRQIYQGIAVLYEQRAADHAGPQQDIGALNAFLKHG